MLCHVSVRAQRSRPRSAGLSRDKHKGGTAVIAVLALLLLWSLFTNIQVWLDIGGHRASLSSQTPLVKHPVPKLRNLVLVACHAVFIGSDYNKAEDQDAWLLLDYQKVPGQAHSFIEHIQEGISHAEHDPASLLLFSGGQTRKAAGPRSEAEGYWLVAEAAAWWGSHQVRERAFTEEHARDSFENLLFSLCRFYELTGHYPGELTVIGYDFKHERFTDLHRAALRWPDQHFKFVGTPALTAGAQEAEHKVLEAFKKDAFGCEGSLMSKKEDRDPFAVGPYLGNRCPDMEPLLNHCQSTTHSSTTYHEHLPWDSG
ncbi:hypothetical protein WJX82_004782 [Trebouxia sp. C0006]